MIIDRDDGCRPAGGKGDRLCSNYANVALDSAATPALWQEQQDA